MNEGINETTPEISNTDSDSTLSYEALLGDAMKAIDDLSLPVEVKEGLSGIKDPRIASKVASAMLVLSYGLSACSGSANAGTEENKTPEVSNDPTTSEQLPMQEEPQESVESYDEDGEVPVGGFVVEGSSPNPEIADYNLPEFSTYRNLFNEEESSEEIADWLNIIDFIKNEGSVKTEQYLDQKVYVEGSVKAISVPITNGLYVDYDRKLSLYDIKETNFVVEKVLNFERNNQNLQLYSYLPINVFS